MWMGNLVPLVFAVAGAISTVRFGNFAAAITAIIAAWIGVNQVGFFANAIIDRELRQKTKAEGELIGFVFQNSPNGLDAHAEIGLLAVHEESLVIVTEDQSYQLTWKDIDSIKREFNIHSILGLGGWIVLNLQSGEKFKLESRKFNTMLKSRIRTKALIEELRFWRHEKAPAEARALSNLPTDPY